MIVEDSRAPRSLSAFHHRALLLVLLVTGLIVGLLAMHTIASGMNGHGDGPASTMSMSAVAPHHQSAMPDAAGSSATVSGSSDSGREMAAMACILALLFSAPILFSAQPASRLSPARRAELTRAVTLRFRALSATAPPDLDALSISRT